MFLFGYRRSGHLQDYAGGDKGFHQVLDAPSLALSVPLDVIQGNNTRS
jgi:hypothetical protein